MKSRGAKLPGCVRRYVELRRNCHWETLPLLNSLVNLVRLFTNKVECHRFTSAPPKVTVCAHPESSLGGGKCRTHNDKWTLTGEMWYDTGEAKPTNSTNSGIFMRRRSPRVSHKPFLVFEIPATCTWRLLNEVNQQSVGPPHGHSHKRKKKKHSVSWLAGGLFF